MIGPGPEHGDRGVCVECGADVEYVEYTAWNGWDVDVLDAWWAHVSHPADQHDARVS